MRSIVSCGTQGHRLRAWWGSAAGGKTKGEGGGAIPLTTGITGIAPGLAIFPSFSLSSRLANTSDTVSRTIVLRLCMRLSRLAGKLWSSESLPVSEVAAEEGGGGGADGRGTADLLTGVTLA